MYNTKGGKYEEAFPSSIVNSLYERLKQMTKRYESSASSIKYKRKRRCLRLLT
ncbi:hypothetical protein JOC33_003353 [Thalassobacillus pellis]|nr:hypothetical protein [Thalassobacillus pellis]